MGRAAGTGNRGANKGDTPQNMASTPQFDEKGWKTATDAILGARADSVTEVALVNAGLSTVTVV